MKYMLDSKRRQVIDWQIENNGDGSGFITKAVYNLSGKEVPEDELEYLTDKYPETIDEALFDRAIMHAESCYEGDR